MTAVSRPGRAALVPIEIATAGTYRVALSEGAWVDMVRDGTSLPSVAHGHGPRCSGIHKIVDFKLAPGRYALQLSAMQTPQVRLLISRGCGCRTRLDSVMLGVESMSAPCRARHVSSSGAKIGNASARASGCQYG